MRRRRVVRLQRKELFWMLAGFAAIQLVLGAAVEHFWHEVRDPEFVRRAECLRRRRSEAPGRPFILALGSSRMQMGLRGDRLSSGEQAPFVYNFGIPASGPLMQQITLRRLLDVGIRPDFAFVEVMPMSFSQRGGLPLEESSLDAARLQFHEVVRLAPYYVKSRMLFGPWLAARSLPVQRHQAELCEIAALDVSRAAPPSLEERLHIDQHGWRVFGEQVAPEWAEGQLQLTLRQYRRALDDGRPADRMLQALADLLTLCRREGIAAALVIPPESSVFRARYHAGETAIDAALHQLARNLDMPLYDARTWVPDNGFWDGHHLLVSGATRFTERLAREALPDVHSRLKRTASAKATTR